MAVEVLKVLGIATRILAVLVDKSTKLSLARMVCPHQQVCLAIRVSTSRLIIIEKINSCT